MPMSVGMLVSKSLGISISPPEIYLVTSSILLHWSGSRQDAPTNTGRRVNKQESVLSSSSHFHRPGESEISGL
eukprot:2404939-Amphidinium_carterae.1